MRIDDDGGLGVVPVQGRVVSLQKPVILGMTHT